MKDVRFVRTFCVSFWLFSVCLTHYQCLLNCQVLCLQETNESTHEILVLIALRKLNLQIHMRSHPVGLHVWFMVSFVYFHKSCVRTAKALVRLSGCAVSPEPSLFTCAISTKISWADSNEKKFKEQRSPPGGRAEKTWDHEMWTHSKATSYLSQKSLPQVAGHGSSIGCTAASYADGCGFDPHVWQNILSLRFGHEKISTIILSLPLTQEGQLSVTDERMGTTYW